MAWDEGLKLGNILVSSASAKAPLILAVKNAVAKLGEKAKVIAGDTDPDALSAYVADDFWIMPDLSKLTIKQLVASLKNISVNLVIPTRDGELSFWAERKEQLAKFGIFVLVSKPSSIKICLDKLAFYIDTKEGNLGCIPTEGRLENLSESSFVVKERYGAGGEDIGVNIDYDSALAHAQKLQNPIFQPYIEGKEYSIDAWLHVNGQVHGLVVRRRQVVVNGESKVTKTVRDRDIELRAKEVFGHLDLYGPVVMQIIVNDQGIHVIEVNPRFGGASTASIAVGLDLFGWSILDSMKREIPTFHRKSGDVTQIRLSQDRLVYDFNI